MDNIEKHNKQQLIKIVTGIITKFKPQSHKNYFNALVGILCSLEEEIDKDIPNLSQVYKDFANPLKKCLIMVVSLELKGLHHEAYQVYRDILSSILESLIIEENEETPLFRMRADKEAMEKPLGRNDFFHMPIPRRSEVKTYRFSSPGYPCLYLGTSIYSCWEEFHRPTFDQCRVAKFKFVHEDPNAKFRVLDISLTSLSPEMDYSILIPRIIIIITHMMKVKDYKAVYKPEYILPQFLTSLIIENNYVQMNAPQKKFIYGVKYTSSHFNKDFKYNINRMTNYAIPVIYPYPFGEEKPDDFADDGYKFCSELCRSFMLTKPTYYEYENLRGNIEIVSTQPLSETDSYDRSSFGKLEKVFELSADNKEFRMERISNFYAIKKRNMNTKGKKVNQKTIRRKVSS